MIYYHTSRKVLAISLIPYLILCALKMDGRLLNLSWFFMLVCLFIPATVTHIAYLIQRRKRDQERENEDLDDPFDTGYEWVSKIHLINERKAEDLIDEINKLKSNDNVIVGTYSIAYCGIDWGFMAFVNIEEKVIK